MWGNGSPHAWGACSPSPILGTPTIKIFMDKKDIKNLVLENLVKIREDLVKSRREYKEAAKDAPSAMQSHSDTSRFQFNTLAENIDIQIQKLDEAVALIKESGEKSVKTEIGAFVAIKENNRKKYFYLVPEGAGGFEVKRDRSIIRALAINSPIGKYFFGKKIGDKIMMNLPAGKREIEILEIK